MFLQWHVALGLEHLEDVVLVVEVHDREVHEALLPDDRPELPQLVFVGQVVLGTRVGAEGGVEPQRPEQWQ